MLGGAERSWRADCGKESTGAWNDAANTREGHLCNVGQMVIAGCAGATSNKRYLDCGAASLSASAAAPSTRSASSSRLSRENGFVR